MDGTKKPFKDYQNQKKRILAQDPHSKVAHGLLFYIEDNQIRSEAITYLKENYDLVCRSGGTLDKQTIKDLIIKYHVWKK